MNPVQDPTGETIELTEETATPETWAEHLIEVEARRARVAELIVTERTYRQIAKIEGVSLSTIANDVKVIRAEWKEAKFGALEDQRDHVRAQLARLMRAVSGPAFGIGGKPPDLEAVREMRALLADVRKLDGLDRPSQVQLSGRIGLSAEQGSTVEALIEVAKQHAATMVESAGRVYDVQAIEG